MSTLAPPPDLAHRIALAEARLARVEAQLRHVPETDDALTTEQAARMVGMSVSGLRKIYARDADLARCSYRPGGTDRAPLRWSRVALEAWRRGRS